MAIGMFGFYAQFLYLFEARIKIFRQLLLKGPTSAGMLAKEDEESQFLPGWTDEHEALFHQLIEELLDKPDRRFYVKTDWSKDTKGAVLCQAGDDEESREAE